MLCGLNHSRDLYFMLCKGLNGNGVKLLIRLLFYARNVFNKHNPEIFKPCSFKAKLSHVPIRKQITWESFLLYNFQFVDYFIRGKRSIRL